MVNATSITIEDFCKVNGVPSTTCAYPYPKVDCLNYKFTLGSKNNVAYITTVPVKTNTTAFDLKNSETNLVKFTWKIECTANNMYFFSNLTTNNGKRAELAVCNSAQQICEKNIDKTSVCNNPIINIYGETFSLNTEILYSMSNLSIDVSNLNQVGMEWMETVKIKCPSSSFNYNLVIMDNEKNQVVQHFSVPNWCVIDYSSHNSKTRRRKLTFSRKGKMLSCLAKTEYFVFNINQLRPCVNYSVSISGSGNVNSIMHTTFFMMRTLDAEDIQNLDIARLLPRFELQWEIPAGCQKVKNFTIPIEKNYKLVENVSLSLNNTKCNDTSTTCTVSWMYDDLEECTLHAFLVSRSTKHVTTPPPGVPSFIFDSPASNKSYFEVEWANLPRQCQGNLTIQKVVDWNGNSSLIGSAPPIPSRECNKYCHTRWRFDKELEPCTTYKLNLSLFTQEITTLPDFSGGIANNMTIRSEVPESPDEPATLVISWDHPHCQKTKDLQWIISIKKSLSNTTIVKPISNLGNSFKYAGVKACERYIFAILTVFENGSTLYSTEEKNFQAECPTVKLLVPISVIAVLLLIAITIALFLCRKRERMDALEKESAHNFNKRTSIESRGRAPSMNHSNKIPSFNHNRISCASRNSCNSRNSSSEYVEMDLDYLPQMTKRPLNIRDICSFDVGQARMEFFLINKLAEKETKRLPRTIAERPENKMKNRFLNTHPYDFNRVLLSHSGDDQNDGYINASFIPGFAEKEKEYIAAQGPKDNTLVDFWQMILEQDVRLIAMVTSLYECGKKKCEKYWPGEDELVIYGDDTQLELLQETTYSFYTIRNILVTKAPDLKREIQQFHFTAWPDFETPDQPEELIRFIEIVRRQARQLNLSSPIVVHCSAGVGRTGTFIALDYLIQQVLITDLVDIPRTVRHLRRLRLSMVQSEAQYVFLYSCIAHYVKTRLSAESG